MPWLEPDEVLPLAGYGPSDPRSDEAIAYAEAMIESYTGLEVGPLREETIVVELYSRSYSLELPLDVKSVEGIMPKLEKGVSLTRGELGWRATQVAYGRTEQLIFGPGVYSVMVKRGLDKADPRLKKAASFLVSHYLSLSDPERSRYRYFSQGGISGAMLVSELLIPEAAALLSYLRDETSVG